MRKGGGGGQSKDQCGATQGAPALAAGSVPVPVAASASPAGNDRAPSNGTQIKLHSARGLPAAAEGAYNAVVG